MHQLRSYINILKEAQHRTDIILPKANDLYRRFSLAGTLIPHSLFYFLDFTQNSYLEVGPGFETFLGYTTSYMKDAGPFFWIERFDLRDFKIMNENVIPANISLLQGLSQCELDDI